MWIIDWLPTFVVHMITLAGLAGLVVSFLVSSLIPTQYRLVAQVVSVLVFAFGLYIEGGLSNEDKWQARVKEMEAKVAQAEAESAKANTKIVEKVVKKLEIVKIRGDDIIQYVDREVAKYDSQCVIPKEFVKAHNNAAEQPK